MLVLIAQLSIFVNFPTESLPIFANVETLKEAASWEGGSVLVYEKCDAMMPTGVEEPQHSAAAMETGLHIS